MTPRLSGHFSIFGLVLFVPKSPLGMLRQWSLEKFEIFNDEVIIANEQPRKDVRLRGSSLIKPCAKVLRQNESQSHVT